MTVRSRRRLPKRHQFAPEPWRRVVFDALPISLCFALLLALWPAAPGLEAPWWAWVGLALYGGLGAWASFRR